MAPTRKRRLKSNEEERVRRGKKRSRGVDEESVETKAESATNKTKSTKSTPVSESPITEKMSLRKRATRVKKVDREPSESESSGSFHDALKDLKSDDSNDKDYDFVSEKSGKKMRTRRKSNISVERSSKKRTKVKKDCIEDQQDMQDLTVEHSRSLGNQVKKTVEAIKENNKSMDVVFQEKSEHKADESSSESEWEDVSETSDRDDDREPVIPKEGVEITVELPDGLRRRHKKKEFDIVDYLRRRVNRFKKDVQEEMHKVNLLCLVARGKFICGIICDDEVKATVMSYIPSGFLETSCQDEATLVKLLRWMAKSFSITKNMKLENQHLDLRNLFLHELRTMSLQSPEHYTMACAVVLQLVGFECRTVYNLQTVSLKPSDLLKAKTKSTGEGEEEKRKSSEMKIDTNFHISTSKLHKNPQTCQGKQETRGIKDDSKSNRIRKQPHPSYKSTGTKVKRNRKALSSDSDFEGDGTIPKSTMKSETDTWLEVYLDGNQWVCVDCFQLKIMKPQEIESQATQPISYVIAFDVEGHVKDVTRRYASGWLSQTRKLRISTDWWEETLEICKAPVSKRDQEEDQKLEDEMMERPLPTSIVLYKNHPLYALKRHLLKFEGIYPPESVPVGFIKGEPVYSRLCVHTLHSRETWLKDARVVRIGEEPYKVVKARPKWNKTMGELQTNLPLELFGNWQTEEYIPPPVVNGKVPRNEFGNVELFKPCMLPKGAVQIRVPGLNRVARKLGIDCAPAMVGWDFHGVGSHPMYDGWVVSEEHHDTLLDAWQQEQENTEKKEREKREKVIYENWYRLIKGVLIRERLRIKYDSKVEDTTEMEVCVKQNVENDKPLKPKPRNSKQQRTKQSS